MIRQEWFERSFDFTRSPSLYPWSIQENIGHLLDLEPLWLERAEQLFRGAAEMAPADLTNRRTHEADHNARQLADLLGAFRVARAELVRLLSQADEATIVRSALHPRLRTPMRLIDLAFFVAEHDDHHLAAITELLARWGAE